MRWANIRIYKRKVCSQRPITYRTVSFPEKVIVVTTVPPAFVGCGGYMWPPSRRAVVSTDMVEVLVVLVPLSIM